LGAKAAIAATAAIAAAGIDKSEIDLVIYAALNPDCFFPGNGVFIEELLGLKTAGAVVVQATEEDRGVLASVLHSQGRFAKDVWLEVPTAVVRERVTPGLIEQGRHYPTMDGELVFKHATGRFCDAVNEVPERGGHTIDEVDLRVPHQANQRITEAVGSRMGLPAQKVVSNIERYGNTTAATIPIALSEAVAAGRIQPGNLVVTLAFGSGFTWGADLIRW